MRTWGRTDCLPVRMALFLLVVLAMGLNPAAIMAAPGITYVVQPGDNLSLIALTHGTTAEAIVQANGLPGADLIWVGQELTIPVQDIDVSGAGQGSGTDIHVVQLGETLAQIALANRTTVSALINANGITDPNMLYVGQKLLIPGPPSASSLPDAVSGITHVVAAGDTLGQIATQYGTTAAAVARANRLTSPNLIYIGMALRIPAAIDPPSDYSGQASRFVVSISQQRCWLYSGNTIIADWICSTGQWGAGTRAGTFKIQSKMERAFGSTWNIWMPYWLGIYWAGASENGIHGIPYDADTGWRLWEGYVGTPVTFGCVLLNDQNAKTLYDMAYIGMPVIIQP